MSIVHNESISPSDRGKDDVTEILACDPTAAASAIPVADLGFILWVVLGLQAHRWPYSATANLWVGRSNSQTTIAVLTTFQIRPLRNATR